MNAQLTAATGIVTETATLVDYACGHGAQIMGFRAVGDLIACTHCGGAIVAVTEAFTVEVATNVTVDVTP
jgi:hypothetical protein